MATSITNITELQAISDDLTADYELANDIPASGTAFTSLGTFTGELDGKGFVVNNLTITLNASGAQDGALFTRNDGTIKNLGLVDCAISVTSTTADADGAALAIENRGTIMHCYSTGTVTCVGHRTPAGTSEAGGLVILNWTGAEICESYSTATVSVNGRDAEAGGFVDWNYGYIGRCYATGNVTVDARLRAQSGGFVAENYTDGTNIGEIEDCYAKGNASATHDEAEYYCRAGGFIAYNVTGTAGATVENSYSIGTTTSDITQGGFCAVNDSTITDCFWDTETSSDATSDGGTGKTTAQMKLQATFTNWNFADIWAINSLINSGYPYLTTITRPYTTPVIYDDHGRIAKGARIQAFRNDTGHLVETETLASNGKATFTDLPNNVGVTFWTSWGGSSTNNKSQLLFSTIIGVAEGGTGSSNAETSRTNLGLAIGSDVQAWDDDLDDIAALAKTNSNFIVGDGTDWVAESGNTARTSLGLGTGDSPQFTAIELGHVTDTTIARESAGKVSVEGTVIVRPANYVVAANGAPTHVKAQADYTCDGTNDHVEIQAAIDALPATGGKVLLTEGTFNIETSLTLDSYQTLQGMGRSTILTTTTADLDIITATGSSDSEKVGIFLTDFCIDGDAGSATNDIGIKWTYIDDSKITNVYCIDNGEYGMYLEYCDSNTVSFNTVTGNGYTGIFPINADNNDITDNICTSNGWSGISLDVASNNSIVRNVCTGNSEDGASLTTNSDHNTIMGNVCRANTLDGIALSVSQYNGIMGNVCQGNGEDGIDLATSHNNNIIGNVCTENSQTTTNVGDDIFLNASDYNLITGNLCRAGGETNKPQYGINISNATCNENKVINNDLYDDGFVTGTLNDSGTDTIIVYPVAVDDTPVNGATTAPVSSNWAFDHNAATTGTHGLGAYTFADATSAAVTLYVDAGSGSDGNAGTSGSPKATILGALDALPATIAHIPTICVRGQQDYPENNTALDFSRFTTLSYIIIKAVNSSDEDMYDNGLASGGGNNYLDDAANGKSWSADQFNSAYIWIYGGTGAGQVRTISDTTSTRITVSANWATNPDGTSYYTIGGGATMTGTGTRHVLSEGKKVSIQGFRHTGATAYDVDGTQLASVKMNYNYCATSVIGIRILDLSIGASVLFNCFDCSSKGVQVQTSTATPRANLVIGATYGIQITRLAIAHMSASAAYKNYLKDCTTGIILAQSGGCLDASNQNFNGCTTDINPAVSTTVPAWWT